MQSTANLGTMSTLQQLRLHQLANRHGSTVATIQQPQQHPHSRPARHVNTTVLDRFQAALHPRQQSDAMAVSSGQVSLAQAALTVARSRVESNRRGDNDGSSWLDRNALDVAMLLHGQATTEQLLRSALLNQQQQQQQQQHDNGTGIRAYLHQTPSLGVVDRYSTFPLNDVETIRRLDEHASNINPTAVAPLGTLSHLSVPMSQAERLQQLLDHRADAMLQRRAAATLPVDSHGPSASAIVGRGGGGSESEPLVAMTATAAPPVIFGRAEQVNIENASTTCTDAHLQAINQALSNDDERKPQARRPY
jgi:hypothetical protein